MILVRHLHVEQTPSDIQLQHMVDHFYQQHHMVDVGNDVYYIDKLDKDVKTKLQGPFLTKKYTKYMKASRID